MSAAWKNVVLGEVADVFNGKTPSKAEQRPEGHPVLKIKDVSELGEYRGRFESFVDHELAAKFSKQLVREGDTLILNAAHNADYVASKTYHAQPPTFGALATGEWLIVRPGEQSLDAGFVHRWVNSTHTRRQLRELVNGIHLYPKDVARLKIPLPPLAEQRRIAEVLDRAEALRAKRRAALAQLDSLTQSLFLDLFGDPVTNSKGWERIELGKMAERITKGESPKWQGFEYQDAGALFVTSENVRLGAIDLSAPKFIPLEFNRKLGRSELRPGDLLVNLVGASIGRSCVFPGYDRPANINQAVAVITIDPSRLEHTFLAGLLTSERGQSLLLNNRVEGARANISLTDLRDLDLPVPPLPLQREFGRRVQTVEKLKTTQRASLAELDALFASLQHRAFRGEL